MDRADAATTLFWWHLRGEQDLVGAASGDGEGTLLSRVEAIAGRVLPTAPPVLGSGSPADFLRLDEELAVDRLRHQMRALGALLRPEERTRVEAALESDVLPATRISGLQFLLDHVAARETRKVMQKDFEAFAFPGGRRIRPPASLLRAVLLFSRDGRVLATQGVTSGVDVTAVSELVARGEPGSTWSLQHVVGTFLGHVGARAALVAVFAGRPGPGAGGTLHVSLDALERRDRLGHALGHPSGHEVLAAYLRAVRALLERNA